MAILAYSVTVFVGSAGTYTGVAYLGHTSLAVYYIHTRRWTCIILKCFTSIAGCTISALCIDTTFTSRIASVPTIVATVAIIANTLTIHALTSSSACVDTRNITTEYIRLWAVNLSIIPWNRNVTSSWYWSRDCCLRSVTGSGYLDCR